MSYAVMPLADYDAACDKVREKVGEKTILFEETDFGYLRSAIFTVAKTGQYLFSFEFSDPSKFNSDTFYYNFPEWEGESSPGYFERIDNNNATAYLYAGQQHRIFISDDLGLTPKDILKATLSIDEEVVVDFVPPLKIKSGEMADRVDNVFEAGQKSMVDESKIIEKTVSGKGIVRVDDVSEIPHEVSVKLSGEPVFTGAGLLEGCTFEDTDFYYVRSTPFSVSVSGDYTIAVKLKDDSKWSDWVVAWPTWAADDSPPFNGYNNPSTEHLTLESGTEYRLFLGNGNGLTASDILSATIEIGESVTAPEPTQPDFSGTKIVVSGSIASEYESAIETTEYIANADGTVDGVKLLLPITTIQTDDNIDITLTYHKSWGMQAERERFWSEFFKGGAFGAMFAGGGWNVETFKPIYPAEKIKITTRNGGDRLFYNFNRPSSYATPLVDLAECCEHIDFSEMPYADRVFNNARAKNITVDFGKCTGLEYAFASGNGGQLENVTVRVTETCIGYINPFFYQSEMKELHFTEDSVIAANITFAQSSALTHDSLMSIINALKDYSGTTTTRTLTLHTNSKALLTDSEKAIATEKGWTIA